MKITIYELLEMIKDGKMPKTIKYDSYIYHWEGDNYYREYNGEYLSLTFDHYIISILTDEVEILNKSLKEEKKIEKPILDTDNDVNGSYDIVIINDVKYEISKTERYILGKIGEIIDCLESKGD